MGETFYSRPGKITLVQYKLINQDIMRTTLELISILEQINQLGGIAQRGVKAAKLMEKYYDLVKRNRVNEVDQSEINELKQEAYDLINAPLE